MVNTLATVDEKIAQHAVLLDYSSICPANRIDGNALLKMHCSEKISLTAPQPCEKMHQWKRTLSSFKETRALYGE